MAIRFIVTVQVVSEFELDVTYSQPVSENELNALDFETLPGLTTIASFAQQTPSTIRFTGDDPVEEEIDLAYTGTTPNILTPQTVPITP